MLVPAVASDVDSTLAAGAADTLAQVLEVTGMVPVVQTVVERIAVEELVARNAAGHVGLGEQAHSWRTAVVPSFAPAVGTATVPCLGYGRWEVVLVTLAPLEGSRLHLAVGLVACSRWRYMPLLQ